MTNVVSQRKKSECVFEKLEKVIPGGVNSPVRAFTGLNQTPLVVSSGNGAILTDADGKHYIDYCCSWGPLIHGHAHPKILEAVVERIQKGTSFGITTEIEEMLARKVVDLVESVERVRFVSSGTEATMSAVRLARGFTKKNLIVKFTGNYHGHADGFLVQAGSGLAMQSAAASSAGVPDAMVQDCISLTYNDTISVREFLRRSDVKGRLAGVIIEPVAGNMGVVPASLEFLTMLREETRRCDALLIFDEVITGFRLSLQGCQGLIAIKPDLTCFGKIIGGGFPAAAFGGRRDVMEYLAPLGSVYQAGTLSGNPVAMEAGYQTLSMLEKPGFYQTLQELTNVITEPVKEALRGCNACLQQEGSLFTIFFGKNEVRNMDDAREGDLEAFARFFRYMFENDVYLPPSQFEACFVSAVHTEEQLVKTRDLILDFFEPQIRLQSRVVC